ncbi:Hypothetical protein A7982_01690 [Minicystis rosea]|nr:Hypothetical protein A7982_01690 [Minicystis rosea]
MANGLQRGVRIDPLWTGIKLGGRPLSYGKVLAFEPDTNTPKMLWKSSDRSVPWNGPNGNQVDLDEHGKALVYGHGLYQLVICDRTLVPLETWEPRFYGHDVVSARDFGAVGGGDDSIDEDTGALQAAIDHCIRTGAKLFIPAGVYKLKDSLRIHRLSLTPDAHPLSSRVPSAPFDRRVFAPFSLEIIGERGAFGIAGNDTVLLATFADRPAIAIQGASGVTLSRLTVEGLNDYLLEEGDPIALLDDRTFVAALCRDGDNRLPAARDNAIHSPYAGVVIDPYGVGGPPADGGYPGHEDDYHRNGLASTDVTLEECTFSRFVAGVLVSPSGAARKPERITVSASSFEHNKVAVAVCQGTSDDVTLRNLRALGGLFFVSTCSYGDGAPSAEAPSIRGAVVESTKYLFNVNAPDRSVVVEGVACASTLGLGFIESAYGADQPTLTFVGCTFDIVQTSPAIDTHLTSSASVRFVGCSFTSSDRGLPIRFCNAGPLSFSSCAFLDVGTDGSGFTAPDPSEVCFVGFESLEKVTFESCNVGDRSLPSQIMVLDRMHRTSRISSLNRTYVLPGSLIIAADMSAAPMEVSAEAKVLSLRGVTLTRDPRVPGEVTFVAPDPSVIKPGDLVFAAAPGFVPEHYGTARRSRGVCGVIKSVLGANVRLTSVVKSLPEGKQDLSVKYFPRLHLPSSGTTTAGSDVIHDVTNARTWRQHDRISGAGIPEGAYVADPVYSGATRIRISKAATASGNVRLYDADITRFADQRGTFLRIDPPLAKAVPRAPIHVDPIEPAPSTRRTLIP